jgi:hypothetical protein
MTFLVKITTESKINQFMYLHCPSHREFSLQAQESCCAPALRPHPEKAKKAKKKNSF